MTLDLEGMFKPISLYIGLRYTRARRSNHFISFIALVSMVGLTLGVAVLITVLSVMNGFDRELKNRVLGMVPQATVSSTQILTDWPELIKRVENHPHVTGVAPFTQLQGMLTAQGQVAGIMVTGIDPKYEKHVSIIQNHIVAGSLDSLKKGEFGIVLGKDMADSLGLRLNDSVTLVLPEATPSPAGVVPRFKRFKVVGIFSVGAEVDSMVGYIALYDASTLLRLPDGAQGVRLKMDDIFAAPQVADDIVKNLPSNFYATNWTPSMITKIFMVQGTVIGVIGTVAGTVLGVILALTISDIISWFNNVLGLNLFDAYFVHYLPSYLRWQDVTIIVIVSLLLSFLATIYPALRAAKVQPAEALRYE